MDSLTALLILSLVGFIANDESSEEIYYWRKWRPGTSMPSCAVSGGYQTYVGRVKSTNGRITAMIDLTIDAAIAIHHKKVVHKKGIEVLCSDQQDRLYWERIDWANLEQDFLDNAIIAGFQKDISSYLYVGRSDRPFFYKVGKVIPPNRDGSGLWLWEGEQLIRLVKFEILKFEEPEIYWMTWTPSLKIPKRAVVADVGRYVGRIITDVGRITAMIGKKSNVAVAIHEEKKMIYTTGVEILCSRYRDNLYWKSVHLDKLSDEILNEALIAGFQKDIGSRVYVGRAQQPNLYKVGKVIPPTKERAGLWIWQDETPLCFTKFELLMINNDE